MEAKLVGGPHTVGLYDLGSLDALTRLGIYTREFYTWAPATVLASLNAITRLGVYTLGVYSQVVYV